MAMNNGTRWQTEVDQIESIADTKGVEIDDIEVNETETEDGDDLVTFRIYETKAESEEDSVGVQVSKMPNVQTGDMTFRNDIQRKLSKLKQHVSGDDEVPDPPEPETESTVTRNRYRPDPSGDGPGSQLDAEINAIHDRIDELEARMDEFEEKSEALDGLQQLMGGDDE